jgi:hypothetical protein
MKKLSIIGITLFIVSGILLVLSGTDYLAYKQAFENYKKEPVKLGSSPPLPSMDNFVNHIIIGLIFLVGAGSITTISKYHNSRNKIE